MSRLRLSAILCAILFFVFAASPLHAVDPVKQLAPEYRHWLIEEVPYIIQTEERNQFLVLKSNAERDNFIQAFWAARNPNPNAETNAFKEEHYRRLAYANQHFGSVEQQNGWRTDQGRIYITLGEPKQRMTYPNARNVRPIISWFYESGTPALPSYFYVLFYKRSIGEPYTIYSPYQDGPMRLTTGLEDKNDQSRALQSIRKSLGDEVARLSITLIPAEPADLNNYSPSMDSDVMLATIKGLPDNELERRRINYSRAREKITASIINPDNAPELSHLITRDERDASTLSYMLSYPEPNPRIIGNRKDKSLGYSMTLRTHIVTADKKPVYDEVTTLDAPTTDAEADLIRKHRFTAETRMPLAAGTYTVETTLTNDLTLDANRSSEQIVVPAHTPNALGLSDLLVYTDSPARDPDGELPFTLSRLRFLPRAAQIVSIHAGERVPLVFQIWLPQKPTALSPPVHLHYLFGSVNGSSQALNESDEDVDVVNADADGNLVTGHTLDTANLTLGNYRVVVKATQDGTAPAFATMNLRVVSAQVVLDQFNAYGPINPANDDLKRGISAQAQGRPAEAERWYVSDLILDPNNQKALSNLAFVLSAQGKTAAVAALHERSSFRNAVAPATLLLVADALKSTGDPKSGVAMLKEQLNLQSPTAALYRKLEDLYEAAGDHSNAVEAHKQAVALGK